MQVFKTIKAIFYDLDGTLRLNDPSGRIVFADFAQTLGVQSDSSVRQRAAVWEHAYFAESPELVSDRENFRDDSPAFWLNYSRRQLEVLGASPEQADALAPQMRDYMGGQYRPKDIVLDEVRTTLATLRERGYFLGILSNRFEPYTDTLNRLGLGQAFDLVVHAGEAGIRKPNPEVFHYMLQKAGMPAAESLYVGDNYFADAVGARRAGLQPVLYDRDKLFGQPDCPVITSHDQLLNLLDGRNEWPGNVN